MKDNLPYIRMWIADYMLDTPNLDTVQHGAYHLLIYAYWTRQGPLPDDDRQLAAIVKMTPRAWRAMRQTMADFFIVANGVWTHKRVEAELKDAREALSRAKFRGARGAKSRWKNEADRNDVRDEISQKKAIFENETDGPSIGQASSEQCLADETRIAPTATSIRKTLSIESATPGRGCGVAEGVSEIWNRGIEILTHSGVPERRARSLIGRWIRAHDSPAVIAALLRAESQAAAEPVAFIEGLLNHDQRTKAPRRGDPDYVGGIAGHLVAYFSERDGLAVERGGRDSDDRGPAGTLPAP